MRVHLGISDPGEEIVKNCINNNIEVIPIPGACALISAIIASGFSTREFVFLGFLSSVKKEREEKLEEIKYDKKTIIIYEPPHRINKTLESIENVLGDRNVVLAREITKIHEEFIRGKVSNIIEKNLESKGEYVILIEGSIESEKDIEINMLNNLTLKEHYKFYEEKGFDKKEIIKKIAKDRNTNKNEIYKEFV